MTIKGVFPMGVLLALFLCGYAAESQSAQRTTPLSVEKKGSDVEPEAGPPALQVTITGEPRGVLSLRQALHETLLNNPELLAFSFELRAIEARRLQAGLLPNPELSAELENFGGTGSTRGVQSSETTIQLSQLIELGENVPNAFTWPVLSAMSPALTMRQNAWRFSPIPQKPSWKPLPPKSAWR